ncbi:MarR family winged helix-turn-helix transcriptional regulator [Dyella sp.]|uniref:MarR family winged helix-turn-helix transcriptional regulator n=1 Tax=Dyella sp. TaxID=1869338 RepID=UPI002ECFD866
MKPLDLMNTSQQSANLAVELRVVIGQLKRRLREQGHMGELSSAQIAVLSRLERDGASTITALAQAEGMRPQSMGTHIAALEAAGLVTGVPDPNDGRRTLWSVTAACRKRIRQGRAAREDWILRAIEQHLSPQEQQQLSAALVLLKRFVDGERA